MHIAELSFVGGNQLPAEHKDGVRLNSHLASEEEEEEDVSGAQMETHPCCGSANPKVYSYLFPGLRRTDPSESGQTEKALVKSLRNKSGAQPLVVSMGQNGTIWNACLLRRSRMPSTYFLTQTHTNSCRTACTVNLKIIYKNNTQLQTYKSDRLSL